MRRSRILLTSVLLGLPLSLACAAPSDVETGDQDKATLERLAALEESNEALKASARELEDKIQRFEALAQRLESTAPERRPGGKARRPPSVLPVGSTTDPDLKNPFDDTEARANSIYAGIQCDDEGERCTIQRSVIDTLLADPELLMRQVRAIPALKDGVQIGFKFYAIRPNSVPRGLGLRNGDLLESINGHPLDSILTPTGLINTLREADRLELVGTRRGVPLTLSHTIVED